MRPAETLELAPLPADLHRVEGALRDAVRSPDRFLDEVASHLVTAGGKRIRPVARERDESGAASVVRAARRERANSGNRVGTNRRAVSFVVPTEWQKLAQAAE